jgi:hypothetical protein
MGDRTPSPVITTLRMYDDFFLERDFVCKIKHYLITKVNLPVLLVSQQLGTKTDAETVTYSKLLKLQSDSGTSNVVPERTRWSSVNRSILANEAGRELSKFCPTSKMIKFFRLPISSGNSVILL